MLLKDCEEQFNEFAKKCVGLEWWTAPLIGEEFLHRPFYNSSVGFSMLSLCLGKA